MPTRRTEPTHEADTAPRDAAAANVESPSADSPSQPEAAAAQPRRSSPDSARAEAGRMQGANGPLHHPDPDETNPAGDQDIDTAGTDADPLTRP